LTIGSKYVKLFIVATNNITRRIIKMSFSIRSKKIVSSVMAFAMLTAATAAADTSIVKNIIPTNTITADAAVSGNWSYEVIDSSRCRVTGYNGTSGTVHIPEAIANHTVVAIGNGAFSGNENIVNVYIPRGISQIPMNAFKDAHNLKTVVVPEATSRICASAFEGCSALETVTGYTNIQYIETKAFKNSGLKSFTTYQNASGQHSIGSKAFENCHRLTTVKLYGNWSIASEAFSGCENLYNIEYNNMSTIESAFSKSGFKGANSLTYLNGAQIFARKAGQKYILQKYLPYVNRYASKLRADNVKLYMDYYYAT